MSNFINLPIPVCTMGVYGTRYLTRLIVEGVIIITMLFFILKCIISSVIDAITRAKGKKVVLLVVVVSSSVSVFNFQYYCNSYNNNIIIINHNSIMIILKNVKDCSLILTTKNILLEYRSCFCGEEVLLDFLPTNGRVSM